MNLGYFDDDNKEYVITTPRTPLPWINYLGCESFFRLISNTGGGYAFYKDAKLLRLTRYAITMLRLILTVTIFILTITDASGIRDGSLYRLNLTATNVVMVLDIQHTKAAKMALKHMLHHLFQLEQTVSLHV